MFIVLIRYDNKATTDTMLSHIFQLYMQQRLE